VLLYSIDAREEKKEEAAFVPIATKQGKEKGGEDLRSSKE